MAKTPKIKAVKPLMHEQGLLSVYGEGDWDPDQGKYTGCEDVAQIRIHKDFAIVRKAELEVLKELAQQAKDGHEQWCEVAQAMGCSDTDPDAVLARAQALNGTLTDGHIVAGCRAAFEAMRDTDDSLGTWDETVAQESVNSPAIRSMKHMIRMVAIAILRERSR